MRISETSRNTELAKALRNRGVPAASQRKGVLEDTGKEPDVFVSFPMGSPVLVECKYEGHETELERRAAERLGKRLASDLGGSRVGRVMMAVYPKTLMAGGKVKDSPLRRAVLIGDPGQHERFPELGQHRRRFGCSV